MASWNKDRPSGTEAWNLGDGRIRDNFDFLEQALQVISTFANNPANPTDKMAGRFLNGNLVTRPVMSLVGHTGAVFYAQDTGELYICTDGTTNAWGQILKFGNPVTITGNLTSTGVITGALQTSSAYTALGLISAFAGIYVQSLQTLKGPASQSWLVNDAGSPQVMDPLAHGARHRPGGTDGVWQEQNDLVPNSLQRILLSTALLNTGTIGVAGSGVDTQTFGAAGDAKCSITLSTAGRPTTSHGLLFAECNCRKSTGGSMNQQLIQMGLFRDAIGNRLGARNYRFFESDVSDGLGLQTITAVRRVTALSAGAHEFALHLWSDEAVAPTVTDVQLMYLDLGTE